MAIKLSIITINYNNVAGLKKTLDSVAVQTCTDFEHIIVDGGSTDGSVEVVEAYASVAACETSSNDIEDVVTAANAAAISQPANGAQLRNAIQLANGTLPAHNAHYQIQWISEKDTGIYNAMNKGVRMATGEYTLMLNSGDYLVDENVIERIISLFDGTDIIQGNTIEDYHNKKVRNRGYGKSNIDFFDVMKGYFLHQASFCRRDLFDRYGMFDESYRIIGDTKFFMTSLGINNASFKYVDVDVANYETTGISAEKHGQWADRRAKEFRRMRDELYSKRLNSFFEDNDKKVRLYNTLHQHRWIWKIVMLLVHIHDFLYTKEKLPPFKNTVQ